MLLQAHCYARFRRQKVFFKKGKDCMIRKLVKLPQVDRIVMSYESTKRKFIREQKVPSRWQQLLNVTLQRAKTHDVDHRLFLFLFSLAYLCSSCPLLSVTIDFLCVSFALTARQTIISRGRKMYNTEEIEQTSECFVRETHYEGKLAPMTSVET